MCKYKTSLQKIIQLNLQRNSLNNSYCIRDPCAKFNSCCNLDSIDLNKIQNGGNFYTKDYVNNIKNLYEKKLMIYNLKI